MFIYTFLDFFSLCFCFLPLFDSKGAHSGKSLSFSTVCTLALYEMQLGSTVGTETMEAADTKAPVIYCFLVWLHTFLYKT